MFVFALPFVQISKRIDFTEEPIVAYDDDNEFNQGNNTGLALKQKLKSAVSMFDNEENENRDDLTESRILEEDGGGDENDEEVNISKLLKQENDRSVLKRVSVKNENQNDEKDPN